MPVLKTLRIVGFMTALAVLAVSAQPAGGRIEGRILDAESGEPVIGANVLVSATGRGAATDMEGRFRITAVPPGTYDVTVSALSYSRTRISGVVVVAGEHVALNVALKPETITTQEVVVEARAIESFEAALLTKQKKAASIGDGISMEQVRRSPDATSADALRRVTGVSLVDNKLVFVRGTPERYSITMMNGASVSSTEPDKRAFNFDLIPSNLLENAVITKSFTPDLPADFAGGAVRMNTIDFPPALTFRLGYTVGYNANASLRSFQSSHNGATDFLGIDDGTRALPESFPENVNQVSQNATTLNALGQTLQNTWAPVTRKAPLNQSFSVSLGDGATLLGADFGFVIGLTYKSSFDRSAIERNEYETSGEPRYEYAGTQSTYTAAWGGLANLSYRLGDFHTLSIKNTYSRSADDEVSVFRGIQYTDIGAEQVHTAIRFVARSVFSSQLEGNHFFGGLGGLQAEWRASFSESHRDEPDYRRIIYFRDAGTDDPFAASLGFQPNLKNGGRFFSDMLESSRGIGVDLSLPITMGKLKFGGLTDNRSRDFHSRLLGMVINGRGNGTTENDLYYLPIDRIFDQENFRRNGFTVAEYQNGTNNYTADHTVRAGYLMADLGTTLVGVDLRFIGGARMEGSRQIVRSKDLSGTRDLEINLTTEVILPALSVVASVSPSTNIRAAYSQTVNRPELRELAPFAYFDFNTQTSLQGNPNLRQSSIRNYDLRVETYPAPGEMVAVSLFSKRFADAIEQVVISGTALGSERTFMNAAAAKNDGLEFEGRLSMRYVADALSNLSVRGNYSRIVSSVDVTGTETTQARRNRPLQGQSPYLLNLGLLYDDPRLEASFNILFNRFGPRIAEVATAYEEDVVEQARDMLDIVVTKSLSDRLELKATFKDILANDQVYTQAGKTARRNDKATIYSLGISWKL